MNEFDPSSARCAALDRLNLQAEQHGARVITDERWRRILGWCRAAREASHADGVLVAVAMDEACRARRLALDLVEIAGGIDPDPSASHTERLARIIEHARDALNPDTVR